MEASDDLQVFARSMIAMFQARRTAPATLKYVSLYLEQRSKKTGLKPKDCAERLGYKNVSELHRRIHE